MPLDDGSWCLELGLLTIKLGGFVAQPKCRVAMKAIPIPATDLNAVGALVRNHDEELKRLDAELGRATKRLKTLESRAKLVFLMAESVKEATPGELMRWKKCGNCDETSEHFEVNEPGETVHFKVAGTYAVHLDAYHYNRKPNCFVCELRVGNDVVHKCRGVVNHARGVSSSWRFVLVVEENDELSVKNTCGYVIEHDAILFVQVL